MSVSEFKIMLEIKYLLIDIKMALVLILLIHIGYILIKIFT